MKHVLVSFSLALVAVFAPNTPIRVDDVAMRTAIPSTLNCMPSTETNHQREVHAVVVDMPQRASLEFASPDTWGALPTSDPPDEEFLPTFDPPDEEFPTKSATQVALN
jgi:hypothetical protein